MAYQAKYGAPRKAQKKHSVWNILLTLLVVPLSLFALWSMLNTFTETVGVPQQKTAKSPKLELQQAQLETFLSQSIQQQISALQGTANPRLPTQVQETLPPVKKIYIVPEEAKQGPKPNPNGFGETEDPAVMQEILDRAKVLLDGQTTYFRPDMPRYEGSTVRYYLDDSIVAFTWKEVHDGTVYTMSEVKLSHPSQFRRHLAGGEYGSETQFLTTEMAATVNAVVASSGDFYRFRDFGAIVYEGEVRRVEGTYAETCYIDRYGNMHFTNGGEVLTIADAQAFVDEHDINFSLAFGPILVKDYELVPHSWYGVGEINEGYARSALCQMGELHYIVVAANTTGVYQNIPTIATFAKHIQATGCRMAYALDGGQTATIAMNGELINRPVYGEQRKISDIIYFCTGIPEEK